MRNAATPQSPADEAREDHETWLAEHDAEVKAQALRDAARAMDADAYKMPATWLCDRAERIEAGEIE